MVKKLTVANPSDVFRMQKAFVDALGLPNLCKSMTIHMAVEEIPTVTLTMLMPQEMFDALTPELVLQSGCNLELESEAVDDVPDAEQARVTKNYYNK